MLKATKEVKFESSRTLKKPDQFVLQISRKRRRVEVLKKLFTNCDFVLGSTAKIERLWSIFKCILINNRQRIHCIN